MLLLNYVAYFFAALFTCSVCLSAVSMAADVVKIKIVNTKR